jgi:hypothetical protein
MRCYQSGFFVAILALVGCTDNKAPVEVGKVDPPDSAGPPAASTLEPLVMSQKPAKVASVRDVLAMKDGETVVVSGKTPPDNCKPFNAALAAFLLMAPEDLETPAIKEELSCEDAATCPACKQVFDAHAIRVELVDATGAVVPASLEGFRGLKPGSMLTVEGEVKREGKDKKLVRLVAKRFYPG